MLLKEILSKALVNTSVAKKVQASLSGYVDRRKMGQRFSFILFILL